MVVESVELFIYATYLVYLCSQYNYHCFDGLLLFVHVYLITVAKKPYKHQICPTGSVQCSTNLSQQLPRGDVINLGYTNTLI
jgi:hypothetical protein